MKSRSGMRAGILAVVLSASALAASTPGQGTPPQAAKKALTLENIIGRQSGARQADISPDGPLRGDLR